MSIDLRSAKPSATPAISDDIEVIEDEFTPEITSDMSEKQRKKALKKAAANRKEAADKAFNKRQKFLKKRQAERKKAALKAQPMWRRAMRQVVSWGSLVLIIGGLFIAIFWAGLSVAFVRTGSMRPAYQPGDLIIVASPKIVQPQVGSVIVATPKIGEDQLPAIAHRIIKVNEDGSFTTKGDYNPEPDAWRDYPENVQRTVVAHVPMGWTKNPAVIAVGFTAAGLFMFWPTKPIAEDEEDLDSAEGPDGQSGDGDGDPNSDPGKANIDLADQPDPQKELVGPGSGRR